MELAKKSQWITVVDKFSGTLVFNARGGCFFIKKGFTLNVKSQIFKDGETSRLGELKLKAEGETVGLFKNVEIKLLGEKHQNMDSGVIFKFIQLSEQQLDSLNALVKTLPTVDSDSDLFLDDSDAA